MRIPMELNPKILALAKKPETKNKNWYRVEATLSVPEIWIYGVIGDPYGDGTGVSSLDFAQDLQKLTAKNIRVRINSGGGSIYEGIAIYNAIARYPGEVEVVIDGVAASAASFIAMAGDKIIMSEHSEMMIHDGRFSGYFEGLTVVELKAMMEDIDRLSNNMAQIYANRAGGTASDWRETMSKDTWYSAEKAVEMGLADEVLSTKKVAAPKAVAIIEKQPKEEPIPEVDIPEEEEDALTEEELNDLLSALKEAL